MASSLLAAAGALTAAFIFAQYLLPALVLALFCRDADLKRKYGAEWGLVTGASSGKREAKHRAREREDVTRASGVVGAAFFGVAHATRHRPSPASTHTPATMGDEARS